MTLRGPCASRYNNIEETSRHKLQLQFKESISKRNFEIAQLPMRMKGEVGGVEVVEVMRKHF